MRNVNSIQADIKANRVRLDDEIILDPTDLLHNYSRIPGHKMPDDDFDTVLDLVIKNHARHNEIIQSEFAPSAEILLIIDSLASDFFMRRSGTLNVAEIGCNNGILSFHIAPLIAAYDPDARYACVCNTLGNESGNEWLDLISQINTPDGLSFHAADFTDTALRDGIFDLTIINGTVRIDDPMGTIKEAVRITNTNGIIICFSDDQVLLDDTFRIMFPECRAWSVANRFGVFCANNM